VSDLKNIFVDAGARFWQSGDTATVVYSAPSSTPASIITATGPGEIEGCLAPLPFQLIHRCCLIWLWSSSKDPLPRACSFVASSTIAWIDERAVFQRAARFRLSVRQATHSARRAKVLLRANFFIDDRIIPFSAIRATVEVGILRVTRYHSDDFFNARVFRKIQSMPQRISHDYVSLICSNPSGVV